MNFWNKKRKKSPKFKATKYLSAVTYFLRKMNVLLFGFCMCMYVCVKITHFPDQRNNFLWIQSQWIEWYFLCPIEWNAHLRSKSCSVLIRPWPLVKASFMCNSSFWGKKSKEQNKIPYLHHFPFGFS